MHPLLRHAAERQWGVFTTSDALRAGYGHAELRDLVGSGRWIRLRRGVYVTAGRLAAIEKAGARHRLDCVAVLLALGRSEAALSHGSAARLWGMTVPSRLATTVRLTDPHLTRRGRDFHITQAPLLPADVEVRESLRLTSPTRTLLDCAREWPLEDAVIAMDAALLAGRTTQLRLAAAAAEMKGWRGATQAARAVALADGRSESPLETRGRLRIVGAGFPTPMLQVAIRGPAGLFAVVDAWFDEAAVAIEFDGRIKYTDPWRGRSPERVLWEEKRREDGLRTLDIRFLRLAEADLGPRWPVIEERLRDLLSRPGPAVRRFTATPRARGRLHTGT